MSYREVRGSWAGPSLSSPIETTWIATHGMSYRIGISNDSTRTSRHWNGPFEIAQDFVPLTDLAYLEVDDPDAFITF